MSYISLSVMQGGAITRPFQAQDDYGNPITVFLSSDTLAGKIWAGEDTPVELAFTPTWIDAPTGKWQLSLHSADTLALSIGTHAFQTTATRGSDTVELLTGSLQITKTTGSTTSTITPYCTYNDMTFLAPWIRQITDADTDQAGFTEERIRAREWFDWAVINSYRGASVGLFEQHSTMAFAFGGGVGWRRSLGPSTSLITYLAQNKLIVRRQVSEACAFKAASFIGMRQMAMGGNFVAVGQYCRDMASRLMCSITAEVDLNGDGVGELFINLGATNTLMT